MGEVGDTASAMQRKRVTRWTLVIMAGAVAIVVAVFIVIQNDQNEANELKNAPSNIPTMTPSSTPSNAPSRRPSVAPSGVPSLVPSSFPSATPSLRPSLAPSPSPSIFPTPMLRCLSQEDCIEFGGFCNMDTQLCTNLERAPLSACEAPLDCASEACGFAEFGRFSESRICCYQDVHGPSQVCKGLAHNRQCGGVDEICASGSCLAGTCTAGFQGLGESCDTTPDCAQDDAVCGLQQANPAASFVCCRNGVTNVIVPWSSRRFTICGNLPFGADCFLDELCASGACSGGTCAL